MSRRRIYWGAFILDWFKYLQDEDLTGSDYKILFFLSEKMHIADNRVMLKQKEIADTLHMDKGNVSKCIKRLCEKQFIVKIPGGFMINPHLFYVGKSMSDRPLLRKDFDDFIERNNMDPIFEMNEFDSILHRST